MVIIPSEYKDLQSDGATTASLECGGHGGRGRHQHNSVQTLQRLRARRRRRNGRSPGCSALTTSEEALGGVSARPGPGSIPRPWNDVLIL